MRRLWIILSCLSLVTIGLAQEITVSRCEEVFDLIPENFVKDLNGKDCALVILDFEGTNLKFDGNIVQIETESAKRYRVWMESGRKRMLRIKAQGLYPLLVKFGDYDIIELRSGHVYHLSLGERKRRDDATVLREAVIDSLMVPVIKTNFIFNESTKVDEDIKDKVDFALKNRIKVGDKQMLDILTEGSEKGYYKATLELALGLLEGWYGKKSKELAISRANLLIDQTPIQQCRSVGDRIGDTFPEQAYRCYLKGSLSDPTSGCWSKLGRAYERGKGVTQDLSLAKTIYKYGSRKQFSRENEAIAGLIRLGESLCSKEAMERQSVNIINKGLEDLKDDLEKALDHRQENGRNFAKAFAIRKIMADLYNDKYGAAEVARAYDGIGYPIVNKQEADKYAAVARNIFYEKEKAKVGEFLEEMKGPDTIPFRDYSKARIGDFFYSDGTLTHDPCPRLNPVGIVFTLDPSTQEKENGWSHGLIISLYRAPDRYGIERMNWANNEDTTPGEYYKNAKTASKDMDGWRKAQEMKKDPQSFNAASAALRHEPKLPEGVTSGWYLPSMGQLCLLMENLGGVKLKNGDPVKSDILKTFPNFKVFLENGWGVASSTEKNDKDYFSLCKFNQEKYEISEVKGKYIDRYVPANIWFTGGCLVVPVASF